MKTLAAFLWLTSLTAAAAPIGKLSVPEVSLWGTDGKTHVLRQELGGNSFTVLTFFSADCPCMRDHDAVLESLAAEFGGKGVRFLIVDPETPSTQASVKQEVAERKYPFPILLDTNARLSHAMDAEYATATVIVDAKGKVRYRSGIDSAKRHPDARATPYLRNALNALLAGKDPNPAEPKSLGCVLRQR